MNRQLSKSIFLSYILGAPIVLLTVITTILIPVIYVGKGLSSMSIVLGSGFQTIGFVLAFLVAFWLGGKLAYTGIKNNNLLISTSFKYSVLVNLIIWIVFCLIVGQSTGNSYFIFTPPAIIAVIVSTTITTFTIGFLISYLIKKINNL
ncbi:MAG: hypothetical protein ABJD66_01270 [Cellulophaga sp.]|uniref:hypothetical protein n=1 Tax=Cellulophaga sp. TaxID=1972202 RepID=UPI0032650D49